MQNTEYLNVIVNGTYSDHYTLKFGYDVMRGTEYFCVVLTDECNVMVNSDEISDTLLSN